MRCLCNGLVNNVPVDDTAAHVGKQNPSSYQTNVTIVTRLTYV